MVITRTGKLYAAGSNAFHQLGTGTGSSHPPDRDHGGKSHDLTTFKRIHEDVVWATAACGFNTSLLVARDGRVFACGTCDRGSLGLGPGVTRARVLREITLPAEPSRSSGAAPGAMVLVEIRASIHHVVARSREGTLVGWGNGRKGSLGPALLGRSVFLPTVLADIVPAIEEDVVPRAIAVGKDWTVVVTTTTTTGEGVYRVGPSKTRFPMTFDALSTADDAIEGAGSGGGSQEGQRVVGLSGNWSTIHFLLDSGRVVSRGRGDRGQCVPRDLPPLRQMSSGTEHSVGIGRDGRVYVWGWNEHGNCGHDAADDDDRADVVDVRTLDVPLDQVSGVAGGYGTTFIW